MDYNEGKAKLLDAFHKTRLGSGISVDAEALHAVLYGFPDPRNPPNVAVLIALGMLKRASVIVIKRAPNLPGGDKWALPGGYQEMGESLEEAAVREFREETGGIQLDPARLEYHWHTSVHGGKLNLVFFTTRQLVPIDDFRPNTEATEIKPVWQPEELAFPAHTEALKRFMGS